MASNPKIKTPSQRLVSLGLKNSKLFDVITIGGATRDVFFRTSKGKILENDENICRKYIAFEYDSKIVPDKVHFSYGGGACNTAISFARIGLKAAAFVHLGKEGTGDIVLENLKKAGVNTSVITRDPKLHTAMSFVLSLPSGDRTIFTFQGSNINLDIAKGGEEKIKKDTKWIYITSLRGKAENELDLIAKLVKEAGIKLAFNPGSQQLKGGYKKLKDVLVVTEVLLLNREEAYKLIESSGKKIDLSKEKAILSELKKMGPKIVVVTQNKDGSFASDDDEVFFEECYSSNPVDTTGAGDSFGSTFVAGQILGFSIKESLKLAALNAASVVNQFGSQEGLLGLRELEKISAKTEMSKRYHSFR